jgi:hypothetical protein
VRVPHDPVGNDWKSVSFDRFEQRASFGLPLASRQAAWEDRLTGSTIHGGWLVDESVPAATSALALVPPGPVGAQGAALTGA